MPFTGLGCCVQRRTLAGVGSWRKGKAVGDYPRYLQEAWRVGRGRRNCLWCSRPVLGATVKIGSGVTANVLDLQRACLAFWQMWQVVEPGARGVSVSCGGDTEMRGRAGGDVLWSP